MHVLLAQLAPRRGDLAANWDRLATVVRTHSADLHVFPELFLFGYAPGDQVHRVALVKGDPTVSALTALAKERGAGILVGSPWKSEDRPGEVHNAAVLAGADGSLQVQVKRYLPNFGPFEEATIYTPTDTSTPLAFGAHRLGVQICYDAYFPEVSRELALQAAVLLVILSAAPVTSKGLFEKVLPARAVENACPVVYVNRVGVEDGIVFGGGSQAWDSRGEPLPTESLPLAGGAKEERLDRVEIDLEEVPRWRPFRPVLRDVAHRTPTRARGPVGHRPD
ncbi:MAG: carbon-nitrogen hydrolase family protein [Thermoplasmata archaeon]|nr:carbon-nitrogen hydrolase family protein [Thermoplasmata archaeon]